MDQKPSVGRVVHFYNANLNHNGQGAGPYPATVTQTFEGPYINLKVSAWGVPDWDEGSVSELSASSPQSRYWCWPPRV